MKRKLKIMTHQVDQLKEEISTKEAALVKLHLEQQRIEKEKETLKVPGLQHTLRLASSWWRQFPAHWKQQEQPRKAACSLSC